MLFPLFGSFFSAIILVVTIISLSLLKRMSNKKKVYLLFVIVLVACVLVYQQGYLNLGVTSGGPNGWAKIKPNLQCKSIDASGDLEIPFINGVGATIWLNESGISITENIAWNKPGTEPVCDVISIDTEYVDPGKTFTLTAKGCAVSGNMVSYYGQIPYQVFIGGITSYHLESGEIGLPVE